LEKRVAFASLFLSGLSLGPALAHLLAWPNKRRMGARQYLVAQQAYRGWSWTGTLVAGELAAVGAQVALGWRNRRTRRLSSLAAACIAGAQALFWAYTYPANRRTRNWTMLPAGWKRLRQRWEVSHAGAALLNLGAHAALTRAALR
jgi:hypothetical protein